MIGPTGAVRVMVATRPVDFRKRAEGLAALVREEMKVDPFSGAVYVFRAKRADGWLEDGAFRWPNVRDGVMHLTAAQRSRHYWKGLTGGGSTRRGRQRRRRSWVDLRHSESVATLHSFKCRDRLRGSRPICGAQ